MEEQDGMDALDSVGDSQLSSCRLVLTLNLRAIPAAHAAAVHRLLRLLVCLIAYALLLHQRLARKWKIGVNSVPPQGKKRVSGQEENIYYKNNRGSFWELENRIIGRKKKILC